MQSQGVSPVLGFRCRIGRAEKSPGADVATGEPGPGVLVHVAGMTMVRCRWGSPGADLAEVSPVPVQMWQGVGMVEIVTGLSAVTVPAQTWKD